MGVRFSLAIAVIFVFVFSHCEQVIGEVRYGNSVTINADEVIDDDVYIFAQTIVIDGTVKGDVVAFGQQLWINGTVEGDLNAAGQQIVVNGTVKDDTRFAGQILTVSETANISDDLLAAGLSLTSAANSTVAGETKFAGYETTLAGNFEKTVSLAVARGKLTGTFGDNVEAVVDGNQADPSGFLNNTAASDYRGLTVSDSATIAGDLLYQSPFGATIDPAATIDGEVKFTQTDPVTSEPATIANRSVSIAKQFFGLLLIGLIVVFACPKWTGAVVNNVQQRPVASFGWGILAFIGFIVGMIILGVAMIFFAVLLGFIKLDNLLPALLGMGLLAIGSSIVSFIFFMNWITKVIVSAWAGNRIINGQSWKSRNVLFSLAIGTLIYCLLSLLPAVGSAFSFVVSLIGLGSAAIWMFGKSESPILEKPISTRFDTPKDNQLRDQKEPQCV